MFRRCKRMPAQPFAVRNVVSEFGRRLRVRLSRRIPVEPRQHHLPGPGRVHYWPTRLPTIVHQHPRVLQVWVPTRLPTDRRSLCRYDYTHHYTTSGYFCLHYDTLVYYEMSKVHLPPKILYRS